MMSAMDPHYERLRKLVAEARRRQGLERQIDLMKASGLSKSTVRRFELGEEVGEKALRDISKAVGWTADSAEAILNGGNPTVVVAVGGYPPAQDPYQPLSERLPVSVLDELSSGEIYAADIHDLTIGGGMRIITVAVRHPDELPGQQVSPEQRRRNQRAWSRMQRQIKGLPPLEWEPGDPEEWKQERGDLDHRTVTHE